MRVLAPRRRWRSERPASPRDGKNIPPEVNHASVRRRHVLAATVLPLAGCLDFSGPSESLEDRTDSPKSPETPGTDPRGTPSDESTPGEVTDHVTTTPEVEYALGETHAHEIWRLAVETVDLTTTLRTDAGERYEMPAGEQLLVARATVKNESDDRDGWAAGPFAAVATEQGDGTVVGQPTLVVEHPAFADRPEGGLRVDDLARVAHAEQFDSHGYQVAPGERADVWLVVVVPRGLDRHDVAVAFDGDFQDDVPFPVWWVPEVASEMVG